MPVSVWPRAPVLACFFRRSRISQCWPRRPFSPDVHLSSSSDVHPPFVTIPNHELQHQWLMRPPRKTLERDRERFQFRNSDVFSNRPNNISAITRSRLRCLAIDADAKWSHDVWPTGGVRMPPIMMLLSLMTALSTIWLRWHGGWRGCFPSRYHITDTNIRHLFQYHERCLLSHNPAISRDDPSLSVMLRSGVLANISVRFWEIQTGLNNVDDTATFSNRQEVVFSYFLQMKILLPCPLYLTIL